MTADNYKRMTKAELIGRLQSVESDRPGAGDNRQGITACSAWGAW